MDLPSLLGDHGTFARHGAPLATVARRFTLALFPRSVAPPRRAPHLCAFYLTTTLHNAHPAQSSPTRRAATTRRQARLPSTRSPPFFCSPRTTTARRARRRPRASAPSRATRRTRSRTAPSARALAARRWEANSRVLPNRQEATRRLTTRRTVRSCRRCAPRFRPTRCRCSSRSTCS